MICLSLYYSGVFPDDSVLKNLTANAGDMGLIPWWGRFPWRRKWQPTPVFLPGEYMDGDLQTYRLYRLTSTFSKSMGFHGNV